MKYDSNRLPGSKFCQKFLAADQIPVPCEFLGIEDKFWAHVCSYSQQRPLQIFSGVTVSNFFYAWSQKSQINRFQKYSGYYSKLYSIIFNRTWIAPRHTLTFPARLRPCPAFEKNIYFLRLSRSIFDNWFEFDFADLVPSFQKLTISFCLKINNLFLCSCSAFGD